MTISCVERLIPGALAKEGRHLQRRLLIVRAGISAVDELAHLRRGDRLAVDGGELVAVVAAAAAEAADAAEAAGAEAGDDDRDEDEEQQTPGEPTAGFAAHDGEHEGESR